jgi:hypothetical protein
LRTWLVVGALTVMVAGTVALRTRGGWAATSREVLDISCDRRSAEHCTDLGIDLLLGQHGAVDEERGMAMLERGCQLGSGRGCYWRGFQALERKLVGARQIALASFEAGCRVRYFDACAYGGWLKRQGPIAERDLTAGLTELTHACGNGSALGCTFLGELALDGYPSASERLASARSYEQGCDLGNDFGCLRAAQSFACGRGGVVRHDEALELVTSLCAKGEDQACEQRLVLEDADAGLDVDTPALERAVLRATFAAAQRDNRAGATKGANALDGGVGTLARAALAITFDRLDEADVLLRELSVDGGHPEVEVARHTLAVRREGRPFPDAAWLGWARAGRPDLRHADWLPSVRDQGDPGACNPAPPLPPLNTTNDFLRAVALSPARSRLDAPFDPAIVRAALRFSVDPDLPAKLLALTVLARVSRDDSQLATREFEARARKAFVTEQHDTLFFSLLQTPSDLRTGSASEADLVALEQAVTLPTKQPRR